MTEPAGSFRFSGWFKWVIVASWVVVHGSMIWTLDKGLIFFDESWELLHYQKDVYTIDLSSWHRVANFLYIEKLVAFRLLTYLLISASGFFLGFITMYLFKGILSPVIGGMLFNTAILFLGIPSKIALSYSNLSVIALCFSVSFLLLFLKGSGGVKYLWLMSSAFFVSVVPFVMFTSFLVPLLFFALLWLSVSAEERPKVILVFGSSLLIYPALFFTFIQTPANFLHKFNEAVEYLKFDEDYGLYPIIRWHGKLVLHFAGLPLVLMLSSVFLQKGNWSGWNKKILIILFVTSAGVILFQEVTHQFGQFSVTIWYVFVVVLLITSLPQLLNHQKTICLVLFFILLPYFASVGSEVRFQYKAMGFLPFIMISIIFLLKYNPVSFKVMNAFEILFLVCTINFFSYNFRGGWMTYRTIDQTENYLISPESGGVKLELWKINEINQVRPLIEGKQIVVSHENGWGYVFLSAAKPLYLSFVFRENYFLFFIKKHAVDPSSLTYIELKSDPFPQSFRRFLTTTGQGAKKLKVTETAPALIYSYY